MDTTGYSSEVMLSIVVGGVEAGLSHVGSKSVILEDSPASTPPTNAELRVTVDGVLDSRAIFLPNGIQAGQPRVEYF